jgi:transcriptional regulator with XRE-family HTH domain
MPNIGDRIKRHRELLRLTQLELAEKIKINNSVLSRIEAGKRPVEDSELISFADFFDVDTDYLLGRTDKPRSSVGSDSGRAYRDGGKGWTEDEIQAADEFIQMLRRRDAGKQKGK